jgi:2,4-dienoyl-CoA reductase-like NADH-dependent reductase (Old Yellow Enzyme family)
MLPLLNMPLDLPCGATVPNRLCKAAMTERLADSHSRATPALERLYRLWSAGGAGLLLTGNVQIDRKHLEAAGNVAIDGTEDTAALTALEGFAAAAKSGGAKIWMQISHAGRQTPKTINPHPKAPSAVTVALPGGQFGQPVALTDAEIPALIAQFAHAAAVARQTGFDGVQIHAAHGYLISEFLSPRINLRTDEWGGDLAGRARFLMAVVRRTREAVGADFPVSVKINSADFQRGGFSFEDSQVVVRWLDEAGIDLIEISGGNYEQPSMMQLDGMEPAFEPTVSASTRASPSASISASISASTRAREAYFLKFAPEIRKSLSRAKLMVTGGFRSAAAMEAAIAEDGIDMIGLGRPLCVDPAAPGKLLRGDIAELARWENQLAVGPGWLGPKSPFGLVKAINGFGAQSWYYEQLRSLAENGAAKPALGLLSALITDQRRESARAKSLAPSIA